MFSSTCHHIIKSNHKQNTTTKVNGSHHNYNKGFRMTKSKRKKTTMVPLQSGTSSKTGSTVVTGKSPDADANVDADADSHKNNGGNNNANANNDNDDSNDNDDKYTDVANATQSRVSKKGSTTTENKAIEISAAIAMTTELENMGAKNATTTMPGINNAATMTGTPIAATLTSGSVAVHDSSGSVAVHDSCNTNKGNKNVSIMSDLFFRKWN
jgi:hypothetical protein